MPRSCPRLPLRVRPGRCVCGCCDTPNRVGTTPTCRTTSGPWPPAASRRRTGCAPISPRRGSRRNSSWALRPSEPRETLARVLPGLREGIADPDRTWPLHVRLGGPARAAATRVPERIASAMLVGHNPAMEELAVRIADRGDRLNALREKYPTASARGDRPPRGVVGNDRRSTGRTRAIRRAP